MAEVKLSVSPADLAQSRYFYVPIDMEEGVTRLDVTLSYAKSAACLVDIGIFDPTAKTFPTREGFRGWSGGARSHFFVAVDDATPGYVAGPLPEGQWLVILGLVNLPNGPTEVRLTATVDDRERRSFQPPLATEPVRNGPVWAKGDCHSHTFHSDAKGAPEMLHAQARRAGLDFLFVTDHNTRTAWDRYFATASSADLLFLPGLEITTPPGHGNALGIEGWVDFRLEAKADPHRLVEEVHALGGLFSINHDKPDIPWEHPVPAMDCMEVWQRHWLKNNEISLKKYDARLANRRRITAIGGSDWHQPHDLSENPYGLGTPTTALRCAALNRTGIMAALRKGEGYVTESPSGPSLIATIGGEQMGALMPSSAGRVLSVETYGAVGDDLVLIADGEEIHRQRVDGPRLDIPLPGDLPYVRTQIEAAESRPRLMANYLDWLTKWDRPDDSPLKDDGRPILRALGNPHYFGDWT